MPRNDGKAFSNLVFSWVLLLGGPDLCPPQDLLQVLLILFSCYLSIQHFCCVLFVSIFYSAFVLFLLQLVVDKSKCTLHQIVGRIFFRCFGMSSFVCIIWPCLVTLWVSLLWPIVRFVCGCYFLDHIPLGFVCFAFLSSFAVHSFFNLPFYPHFPSRFYISFQISLGDSYLITD